MSLLSILIYDIINIESEGNGMKRNRYSLSYRIWKFARDFEIKTVWIFLFEFITAVVFFAALFLLPHLLH